MLTITKTREDANDVLRKLEGKVADQWAAPLGGIAAIIGKKKPCSLVARMSFSWMPTASTS